MTGGAATPSGRDALLRVRKTSNSQNPGLFWAGRRGVIRPLCLASYRRKTEFSYNAWNLFFSSGYFDGRDYSRYLGQSVRPVRDPD